MSFQTDEFIRQPTVLPQHRQFLRKNAERFWTPPAPLAICQTVFRRSSAVEQLTVNQLVVGSIPTAGAKINLLAQGLGGFFILVQ